MFWRHPLAISHVLYHQIEDPVGDLLRVAFVVDVASTRQLAPVPSAVLPVRGRDLVLTIVVVAVAVVVVEEEVVEMDQVVVVVLVVD